MLQKVDEEHRSSITELTDFGRYLSAHPSTIPFGSEVGFRKIAAVKSERLLP